MMEKQEAIERLRQQGFNVVDRSRVVTFLTTDLNPGTWRKCHKAIKDLGYVASWGMAVNVKEGNADVDY